MSNRADDLRELLDAKDVAGFLLAYEQQARELVGHPELTGITQRLLPPVLLQALAQGALSLEAIVRLWRLVRTGLLLVVDDAVLSAINDRLPATAPAADGGPASPMEKLRLYGESVASAGRPTSRDRRPAPIGSEGMPEMRRVVIASAIAFGVSAMSDVLNFKKNACASPQEREFLKAVRQFFPNLRAYPNVPLRNFIDTERMKELLPIRTRNYCWSAQVDVLLCTDDEDPVAGIELDSPLHDEEEARERDALKHQVFNLAGLPLIRIRSGEPATVRAEEFYDLLQSEGEELDKLRPRRLRPRREHDFLVPAEVVMRSTPRHD